MSPSAGPLLFLSRDDVKAALPLADCITVVEAAFRNHAEGKGPVEPGVLGAHLHDGGFHVKTAALGSEPCYFAASQPATIGDLHHAIAAGVMHAVDVFAELGQILTGLRPGRTSRDEVFVFDSTGTALQDVAAAALVYGRVTQSAPA